MPKSYSLDFRLKVLKAIDEGQKKSLVSRTFNVSRNTIDLWLDRRETTGSVEPRTYVKRGPDPKISDLDAFRQFVLSHGHLTHSQMAQQWPEPVSRRTIGNAIKRIGFIRKDNVWLPPEE